MRAIPTPEFPPLRRALLVEDNEHTAYLLEFMLHRHGFDVIVARDGREAARAITEGPVTDVVLMDLMLPYMSGFQLIRLLRETPAWDGVPVLVLSGRVLELDVVRAFELGADDFVSKPYRPQELLARIRRLLAEPVPRAGAATLPEPIDATRISAPETTPSEAAPAGPGATEDSVATGEPAAGSDGRALADDGPDAARDPAVAEAATPEAKTSDAPTHEVVIVEAVAPGAATDAAANPEATTHGVVIVEAVTLGTATGQSATDVAAKAAAVIDESTAAGMVEESTGPVAEPTIAGAGPHEKPTPRQEAASKKTVARKPQARKTGSRKPTKKAPARKTAAKKAVSKKAATKKTSSRKTAAKKRVAKKTTPKKTVVKKAAGKKAATRKTAGSTRKKATTNNKPVTVSPDPQNGRDAEGAAAGIPARPEESPA